MHKVIAFDSKEFTRSNAAGEVTFYTPLGCGITVSKEKEFDALYTQKLQEVSTNFKIERCCGAFSPAEYFPKIGPAKTVSLSDQLLKSVQDLVESVYFSYVILPPKEIPIVEVGGYKCPKKEIKTFDFLRNLSVYFSYITAWKYLGIEGRESETILIDGFHGKRTPAWDDIINKVSPIVYSHGDESNPFISIADIVSFLTNKKLWDNYLRLTPENIVQAWKGYPFTTDTHFLDKGILSKIKWYSNEHIELSSFYARPIVFLRADGYNMNQLKLLDVYPEATILAKQKGGCVQGFDKGMDSPKVKNGDIFVYAGEESTKLANTLKDIYDIETMPFKDLREKIRNS